MRPARQTSPHPCTFQRNRLKQRHPPHHSLQVYPQPPDVTTSPASSLVYLGISALSKRFLLVAEVPWPTSTLPTEFCITAFYCLDEAPGPTAIRGGNVYFVLGF